MIKQLKMVMLIAIYWFMIQMLISKLGTRIPESFLTKLNPYFKSHAFEKDGQIWNKVFKVKKWKDYLPDGESINPDVYSKKSVLHTQSTSYMYQFIVETQRAELVHFMSMLPIFVFIKSPKYIQYINMGYVVIANIPCMIVQRYNRPKFERYYSKLIQRNEERS